MTLKQMQYFASICQTQNMSQSARELYVSQPTMSVAIKDLESEVGYSLFKKVGNRLFLTEAGARLYREVRDVLDRYNEMETLIRSGDLQQKYIRFGFSSVSGTVLSSLICRQFLKDCPDIRVHIVEDIGQNLLKMLENDRLDAVLTGISYSLDSHFQGKFKMLELAVEPMVYCVPADSPLAGMPGISPEEIAREPVIMLKENIPMASVLEQFFRDRGCPLNIILRTGQLFTAEQYISAGVGGGFLPAQGCRDNRAIVPLRCPELEAAISFPAALYWRTKDDGAAELVRAAKKVAAGTA